MGAGQADQRYTDEIEPLYGDIEIPVTVCWGLDDEWIPPVRSQQLAAAVPGAELYEVPGPVLELVRRFLAGTQARGSTRDS